jgi:hypothetical protein
MPLSKSILDQLEAMPGILRDAADRLSPGDYSKAPAGGGFSLLEQACHLRDLEREGYLIRIRRILREECPVLEDFDGAKVAAERNYPAQDLRAALEDFQRTRLNAVTTLRSLSDTQLDRRAQFGTTGTITLRQVVEMMLEHDAGHRREIEELLAQLPIARAQTKG